MTSLRHILAAPAACAVLLGGMAVESARRITPTNAAPYHAAAKRAIESIPTHIGSWTATRYAVPVEATKLLKPNEIRCLKYVDNDVNPSTNPRWYDRWATLLVDQCRDARDMNGHWPPNCYVNSGEELTYDQPRDWRVNGLVITGEEYHFSRLTATESSRQAVYDFLIVPGMGRPGIMRNMDGVRKAAEDYQQRYYGAAQFQVMMNADLPQAERDAIFTTLMTPCVPVIKTLMSGDVR